MGILLLHMQSNTVGVNWSHALSYADTPKSPSELTYVILLCFFIVFGQMGLWHALEVDRLERLEHYFLN